MQKFTYCVPTEIIFGKDTERECGKMVKRHGGKKVLDCLWRRQRQAFRASGAGGTLP